jgi:hypothetical protein
VSASTLTVSEEQATVVLHAVAAWMGKRGWGTYDDCDCREPMRPGDDGRDYRPADPSCAACDGSGSIIGPAPTGEGAAHHGLGPMLHMTWDWPGEPTPTVILEGGPDDWGVACSFAVQRAMDEAGVPVFVEPWSGWALCVYPAVS